MKAIFLIFHGFEAHNGISKKILYQVDGLKQNGIDVRLCYLLIDKHGFHKRMVNDITIDNYGKGFLAKIKKRICYNTLKSYILKEQINFLYVRHDLNANPFLVSFFKALKKKNINIILEIPTYPYDNEFIHASWKDRLQNYIDKLYRNCLSKTLYRIVTFTDFSQIWGIQTINISNGIDFNAVKFKSNNKINTDELNLIGVADIHAWHGYDRVIRGMINYYKYNKNIKVYFHIVGNGIMQVINELKQITGDNNLSEYVKFYGPKSGLELDLLFDFADFGIASLARHRSNITNIKTLKNREYAARGIPFIYSEIDTDFENMPYILKAPANEEPIDICQIIDFYSKLNISAKEIRESIYHLSWKNQMKIIIETQNNS
jgi:glycosyltransferase involved in cell wall biosynthesis